MTSSLVFECNLKMSGLTEANCGICYEIIQREDSLKHIFNCCNEGLKKPILTESVVTYYCFLYVLNYIQEQDKRVLHSHPYVIAYVYSLYEVIYYARLGKGHLRIGLQVDNLSRIALSEIDNFYDRYINIFPGFNADHFDHIAFNLTYEVLFSRPQIARLWRGYNGESDSE